MLFYLLILLFIIFTIIFIYCIYIEKKYRYNYDYMNKFEKFIYENNDDWFIPFSSVLSLFSLGAVLICVIIIVINNINGDILKEKNKITYNSLIYKIENKELRDKDGILNKSYIDEIQRWNENLVEYKVKNENSWIGIFYSDKPYESLDLIDIENFK